MKLFKYALNYKGETRVLMPTGAIVRSAGVQGDEIVVWASVEPAHEEKLRFFHVIWTGEDEPSPGWAFVGTVQHPQTGIVSHVFDRGVLGEKAFSR